VGRRENGSVDERSNVSATAHSVGHEGLNINLAQCEGLMKVEALLALHIKKKLLFSPPDPNCPNFVVSRSQMGEMCGNLLYSTHSHPQNLP
jgi:hypothetical protein